MKKIISIILLIVVMAGTGISQAAAPAGKVDSEAMTALISKYQNKDGFTIMSVGGVALGFIKMLADATAESKEDKEALDILDGIRKFVIVEYADASDEKKAAFDKDLSELLKDADKLIEVKENGDNLDIYGTISKDGKRIQDFIINAQNGHSVICIFGSIKIEDLGGVMDVAS